MLDKAPTVSVIMSVYNHKDYVGKAIESILHQTLRNLELIIINDGSIDGSLDVIRKYEKLDSRILVIDQNNQGLTRSLNTGVRKSSGQYIARQDADDISMPNRLEKQLNVLQNFQLDIVTSRALSGGRIVPHNILLKFNKSSILKAGNIFVHGTFFIDKKVFDKQVYNERYRYAQDFKFMLDAFQNGLKVGYMLEALYYLNSVETSISNTQSKEQNKCVEKALSESFGDAAYFLRINKCKKYLKNICKLILSLYLHMCQSKGGVFTLIRRT